MELDHTEITVKTIVKVPVEKAWQCFTEPEHIMKWNHASDDWQTTSSENDLRVGGKFVSRMEAKDGSMGFDFYGTYEEVKLNEVISYTLGDGRKVTIHFNGKDNETVVTEIFEAEKENPMELQQNGWQAILDNFKKYVEQV